MWKKSTNFDDFFIKILVRIKKKYLHKLLNLVQLYKLLQKNDIFVTINKNIVKYDLII